MRAQESDLASVLNMLVKEQKPCLLCHTCSGCSAAAGSSAAAARSANASAAQSYLARAQTAEAEVKRLRSLCAALHSLSREPRRRKEAKIRARSSSPAAATLQPSKKRRRSPSSEQQDLGQAPTLVKCSDLLYTQDSCKNEFADGTKLDTVVLQLIAQERDPLIDPFFVLDVIVWNGSLFSVDNRRLYCLHRYQDYIGRSETLHVRARLHRWLDVFDRFWTHYTTLNGGTSIRLRG